MKRVLSYTKPYKGIAAIAIMLMFVELAVELVQPLIMAKIIDDGIVVSNSEVVWRYGLLLVGLSLLTLVVGISNSYFSAHAAQSYAYDLRNALFRKIQSFTMATYLKFPTSGLITRLTNDVTQVTNVLYMLLRVMLRAPLSVIGSIAMAFYVNAELATYLIIGTPLLFIFLYFMVIKGVQYFATVQSRLDRVNRVLQESLQAIRLVKAYMRGAYESSRFEKVSDSLRFDTVKALRIMELILPILLLVMNAALLAIVWFGAKQINAGDAQVGDLVAIVNYTMRMTGFFSMFSFIIIALSRAKASGERMEEVLAVEDGVEHFTEHPQYTPLNSEELGSIEFDRVSFRYPGINSEVLNQVTFALKPGEKLAIMGATGSGKSTLLNLIPRFYEATEGTVKVNGRDVHEWSLDELRACIGFVPQQSMLFTGTIRDNIGWGQVGATAEEIQLAAKSAQIHHAVESFPQGYETRVGQRGVNLSGGQKQRLSLARALIRKSQILILDDSTSALDVKTEAALWQALEAEQATMLVVTQKIRTAKGLDKILLLDDGAVVGFGSHKELLQHNELYQKIAHSQQEVH